jgi:hypothetical protein
MVPTYHPLRLAPGLLDPGVKWQDKSVKVKKDWSYTSKRRSRLVWAAAQILYILLYVICCRMMRFFLLEMNIDARVKFKVYEAGRHSSKSLDSYLGSVRFESRTRYWLF